MLSENENECETNQFCAVKFVFTNMENAKKEAEFLRNISHNNVVSFREFFEYKNNDVNSCCFIMDFYPITLNILIEKTKTLKINNPYNEKLISESINRICNVSKLNDTDKIKAFTSNDDLFKEYFRQALLALEYLNSKKICHRDIKPENILIKSDKLVICDFGLAKELLNEKAKSSKTGTIKYLAPEMFSNIGYTFKVDIWALGITFLKFYTRKNIFASKFASLQFYRIKKFLYGSYFSSCDSAVYARALDAYLKESKIPNNLSEVFNKALMFNPDDRLSAEELLKLKYFN
ncbi:Serine/threonine kinase [Conglomerata obtusa]